MSEVKRFLPQKTPIGTVMKESPEGYWIQATDFDAQRLRADTAEAELKSICSMACMLEAREWAEHAGNGPTAEKMESAITELHNELAAAEQRNSELIELLTSVVSDTARWMLPGDLHERIRAALNPNPEAESQ